jgi:pimeloyl-ACP methyl ester carboxylesterase
LPPFASFDGVKLHYEAIGDGPPVVLLHEFAADSIVNWVKPKVVAALVDAGWQAITLDARGHGRSDKPHDGAAYADGAMVRDAAALFDHLGIEAAPVVGYSMGALTALRLAAVDRRVTRAVLGGVGLRMVRPDQSEMQELVDGLVADDPATIDSSKGRAFRRFAESTSADRHALAANMVGQMATGPIDLSKPTLPMLLISGDEDFLGGPPGELAASLPNARVQTISGDHLTAITDPRFRDAIVAFIKE